MNPEKDTKAASPFRSLPKVDELLQAAERSEWAIRVPRNVLRAAARNVIDSIRESIRLGKLQNGGIAKDAWGTMLQKSAEALREHSLERVINATGVVLHTGLGRAPLAARAVDAIVEASQSCALEIERDSGERGHRDQAVRRLLIELLGVEDGTVVNNNAAATLLAVNTFALGKEVIVSRGELVEIGGSYRMPAVIERGGAKLIEVGTTNRTRIGDYKSAITARTGLLMKVHTSNYRIGGFTEEAELGELTALGKEANIPVVHDLGSGLLTKSLVPALAGEPTVEESVHCNPDVTLFSGDKLLGGPQAGFVVGRAKAVEAIRKNPMFRAMRLDKLILAAAEQTLKLHLEGEANTTIPVIERLNLQSGVLAERARSLAEKLQKRFAAKNETVNIKLEAECFESVSEAGSGSAPTVGLATHCVAVSVENLSAADLARRLRLSKPAVFSRIYEGRVVFDPRTLAPGDDDAIVASIASALVNN
ncbi:MAG: L-seryl-tRNA(Sec) selenium transferase [Planctomycetota bacterium]